MTNDFSVTNERVFACVIEQPFFGFPRIWNFGFFDVTDFPFGPIASLAHFENSNVLKNNFSFQAIASSSLQLKFSPSIIATSAKDNIF